MKTSDALPKASQRCPSRTEHLGCSVSVHVRWDSRPWSGNLRHGGDVTPWAAIVPGGSGRLRSWTHADCRIPVRQSKGQNGHADHVRQGEPRPPACHRASRWHPYEPRSSLPCGVGCGLRGARAAPLRASASRGRASASGDRASTRVGAWWDHDDSSAHRGLCRTRCGQRGVRIRQRSGSRGRSRSGGGPYGRPRARRGCVCHQGRPRSGGSKRSRRRGSCRVPVAACAASCRDPRPCARR